MLLSKEVEVTLHPSNIKYYEKKEYSLSIYKIKNKRNEWIIPKGTKINVKVEDLLPNSITEVNCLCDFCKKEIVKRKYVYYLKTKDNNDYRDCCDKCATERKNNFGTIGSRSQIQKIEYKEYNEKYNINVDENTSIIEWWKLSYYGNNEGKKILQIPNLLFTEDNIKIVCEYVLEKELKYKNREDFLKINTIIMHKYKIAFHHFDKIQSSPIKLLRFCYPEYDFQEFELNRTSGNYYKNDNNKVKAIDYVINKYNITLEDVLNNKFNLDSNQIMSSIYHKYFKGYHEFWKWYYNKKDIIIRDLDFRIKPNNFWESETNRNEALKDLIFNKLNIKNIEKDIPKYINGVYLKIEYPGIIQVCNKYYGSTNFYKWCINIFPKYKNVWTEENFGKIYLAFDGSKCNSMEERILYEFIKKEINKYIKAIGISRNKKYRFDISEDDRYNKIYPDFVIEYIDKNNIKTQFKKPIIIEYYGLYNENHNNKISKIYYEKTIFKENFYKSRDDIYYIGIFPKDFKKKFQGVREKLTSFFMSNFNIDITKINNKEGVLM